MAKKIAKPAPKPTPKPLPRPKPAPIDLVRNPNFDAAMAQQNYQNSLAGLTARAQAGQFDEGFRADGGQAFPSEFSRPSQEPMISPEVIKKAREEYLASLPKDRAYQDVMTKTKYGGEFGSSVGRGFDKWFEQNYINNPNSALSEQERMTLRIPELKLPPQGQQAGGGNQDIVDFRKRIYDDLMARQGQPFSPDGGMGGAQNFDIDYIEGGQRNAPMTPTPSQIAQFRNAQPNRAGYMPVDPMAGMQDNQNIYNSLRDYQARTYPVPMNQNTAGTGQQFGQIAQGIGRLMPQIPQGQQQMQSYQNFLNQGMNNMASVNQGAAESFANTQPGMPTTGSAQQFTANPAMPVAGMGAQKSRPTPRKFSTVSNSPARFA